MKIVYFLQGPSELAAFVPESWPCYPFPRKFLELFHQGNKGSSDTVIHTPVPNIPLLFFLRFDPVIVLLVSDGAPLRAG